MSEINPSSASSDSSSSSSSSSSSPPSSSLSTTPEWFYIGSDAQQKGPVSTDQLQGLILSGEVDLLVYGWKEGLGEWQPLSAVPALQPLFDQLAQSSSSSTSSSSSSNPSAVWFYLDGASKERVGPVTADELRKLYRSFAINDITMVWKHGFDDWMRLSEVSELSEIAAPADSDEEDEEQKESKESEGAPAKKVLDEEARKRKREKKKKAQQKKKWQNTKDHGNLYVTGLPPDLTEDEAYDIFKKGGVIKKDPITNKYRIKLYTDDQGNRKGDGLVCYLHPDSVSLAIELLDESEIRPGCKIHVQKAEFQMKGTEYQATKKQRTEAPPMTKVHKKLLQSQKQELSWDEEEAVSSKTGLRIVILKYMFTLDEVEQSENPEAFYNELKVEIGSEIEEKCGTVDKITVFEGNPDGVVAIKFANAASSPKCIELMNGRFFAQRRMECDYFDGVTNYKVRESEASEEARHKAFQEWIDQQS